MSSTTGTTGAAGATGPTGFLFAGQGVDPPWVAPDLLARPAARALIAAASDATGADLGRLLARGGRDLARPELLQPALVAACLAAASTLDDVGIRPTLVLGHSLGELTAWAAAGCISPIDAVELAALRGRLMAREAARHPGGMIALGNATAGACRQALAAGRAHGRLAIAAHNAPEEWVLSGDHPALARAQARMPSRRLAVAGAWHSPAMAGAVAELTAALGEVPRAPGRAALVSNRTGQVAAEADIPALLAGQLVRPIRFVAALETVRACRLSRLIAVGPGKLLRALVRRTLGPDIEVRVVNSDRDAQALARERDHMAAHGQHRRRLIW